MPGWVRASSSTLHFGLHPHPHLSWVDRAPPWPTFTTPDPLLLDVSLSTSYVLAWCGGAVEACRKGKDALL